MLKTMVVLGFLLLSVGCLVLGSNRTYGDYTTILMVYQQQTEDHRNGDSQASSWNDTSQENNNTFGDNSTKEVGFTSNTVSPSRSCTLPSSGWSQLYEKYMMYILVAVGLFGNTLSLIVMLRSSSRTRASRLYLIVLSITDNLVLVIFILRADAQHLNDAACISINYCRRLFQSFSAYIVVVICIQRFIMVKYPFQAGKHDSTAHGVFHLVTAFLFAAASSLYQALTAKIRTYGRWKGCCRTTVRTDVFIYAHLSLHVFCAEIAASILVLVLTSITIYGVLKAAEKRKMYVRKPDDQPGKDREQPEKKTKSNADTKLTQMLIVLALVFVTVRMPYTICYWYDYLMWFVHWRSTGRPASVATYTRNMRSTINVFLTLFMANYATNFIVYVALWPSFRRRVINLLSFNDCRKGKEYSSHTESSNNATARTTISENGK